MSRGQVTITQPIGAIPTIAPVMLDVTDETYSRSLNKFMKSGGYTPARSLKLVGRRALGGQYAWTVTPDLLTEEERLRLGELISWQDANIVAAELSNIDPTPLILIDEVYYLDPEPAPHSKTLLSTLTRSSGYVYGFGVFNAFFQQVEQDNELIQGGFGGVGGEAYQYQFTALEIL